MTRPTTPEARPPATADGRLTMPALGRYLIEPHGSTLTFRCWHMYGLGVVRGSFAITSGTVDIAEPAANCRVSAQIDAASFSSGNRTRDEHVRAAKFLDTNRFPTITFTATGLDLTADQPVLRGELTVRQVTRPVTLSVDSAGTRASTAGWFEVRANAVIDRTEFGVTASPGLTGRRLRIALRVRCVRQ